MLRIFTLDDEPPEPLGWIVPGFVPAGGLTTLAGPPGAGKSLLAASLAVATASGSEWLGLPIERGAVLYVAAEAEGSTHRRLAAMVARLPSSPPIAVAGGSINLVDDRAADNLSAAVEEAERRLGVPIRLVILDALGSSTRGANENSAADMSRATGALLDLVERRRLSVVLLAHVGKNGDDDRVRGHSGLLADAAAHLAVKGSGAVKSLVVVKQRDGEAGRSLSFRIIANSDRLDVAAVEGGAARPRQPALSADARFMLRVVSNFGTPVIFEKVRDICRKEFATRSDGSPRSDGAIRQAISNARSVLRERGLVDDDGQTVSVSKSSVTVSET